MKTLGRKNRLTMGGKNKDAERKLRYFYVHKDITFPGILAIFFFV